VVGQFSILRPLGRGGMGEVYLARDLVLGRLVALKFMRTVGHSPESVASLMHEARLTAQLNHPNIVTLYSVGEHGGVPFVVLEYVEGASLSDRLREDALGVRESVRVVLGIARAIAAAHAGGVLHRDLKPANVVTAGDGRVRVLDFGIAKFLGGGALGQGAGIASDRPPSDRPDAPFDECMINGTPPYMAPEQWRGKDAPSIDIWAIGVILYRVLTGNHPYEGPAAQIYAAVTSREPVNAADALRDLPSDLSRLVLRCLAKNPAERPTAAQVVEILEGIHLRGGRDAVGESSPFQGLSPFTEDHADSFFGRDAELESFDERLRRDPFLVIVGASGAGKSSFVRAGVIPRLRDAANWTVLRMRPGRDPMASLAMSLQSGPPSTVPFTGTKKTSVPPEAVADVFGPDMDAGALALALRRNPTMLSVVLNRLAERSSSRVFLFIDQVEELVTLCTDDDERRIFLETISSATADPREPVRVVLAVRDDFFGRIPWGESVRDVGKGVVWLRVPGIEQLRETIVAPLRQRGYDFDDPTVVDQMLASVQGEAGSLPLLQFVLSILWRDRDKTAHLVRRASYEKCGQVAGALAEHAEHVLEGMTDAQLKTARALVLRMVTPQMTRRPVRQHDLLAGLNESAAPILARLVEARLVAMRRDGDEADSFSAELVHEALITRWPRLIRWLADVAGDGEMLGRVGAGATEWEKAGRREGLLWRGEAAEQTRTWYEAYTKAGREPLLPHVEGFVLAVIALLRKTEQRRRALLAGAIASVTVFVLAISYLGLRARRGEARAHEEATRAAEEARRAEAGDREARRQAAQARNATRMAALYNLGSDPTSRLAILREIEGDVPPFKWQEEARSALYAPISQVVFDRHAETVRSVAWSPDGKRVVSADWDGTIHVDEADGAAPTVILKGHENPSLSAVFTRDGKQVVSLSTDKTIRISSVDGTTTRILRNTAGRFLALSPDGETIALATINDVRLFRIDGSGEDRVLSGHSAPVISLAWSSDSRHVVSGSWDKTVRIWSADGQAPPVILRGHTDKVGPVAYSPDGLHVVSSGYDKVIRVWPVDGKTPPVELRGPTEYVLAAAFSPDGQYVAAGSADRLVRIYRADGTGGPLVLGGHTEAVYCVAFSPNGETIASSSADKSVRIWKAHPSNEPLVLSGHTDTVYSVAWSPDDRRVASGATDGTVRVWDADGGGTPLVLKGHEGRVNSVAWSPSGKNIASGSNDDTVRIWNADGAGRALILKGHTAVVYAVAYSPDGTHIASASFDKSLRLWNADGHGEPRVLLGHTDRLSGLAFSPDGRWLASVATDKTLRLWSADGSGEGRILFTSTEALAGVGFSHDSKRIVFGTYEKVVRVINVDGTGEPQIFKGHTNYIEATVFSPDGRFIASSSGDETIRIFPADGSGDTAVLGGHMVDVESIAFSPDGRRLASGSDDKLVRVWHDLQPIRLGDPRLWAATTYCLSEAQYEKVLGFPSDAARASREACTRRIASLHGAAAPKDVALSTAGSEP
jgi:WD40 repeat protein/serine/threonine protein kinase